MNPTTSAILIVNLFLVTSAPVLEVMESRCFSHLHHKCSSMCPDDKDFLQHRENQTLHTCCLLSGCLSCFANLPRGTCGSTVDQLLQHRTHQLMRQIGTTLCLDSNRFPSQECLIFFLERESQRNTIF